MAEAVLAADLAEFAGPVGQDRGKAGVGEAGVGSAAAAVKSPADGPAAVRPVIQGGVEAESTLDLEKARRGELVAVAPEKFAAPNDRVVDGAAQGFPAQGGIRAVEVCEEIAADIVVAAGVGEADIHVGGLAEVLVDAEMLDRADVPTMSGNEEGARTRVAAE